MKRKNEPLFVPPELHRQIIHDMTQYLLPYRNYAPTVKVDRYILKHNGKYVDTVVVTVGADFLPYGGIKTNFQLYDGKPAANRYQLGLKRLANTTSKAYQERTHVENKAEERDIRIKEVEARLAKHIDWLELPGVTQVLPDYDYMIDVTLRLTEEQLIKVYNVLRG